MVGVLQRYVGADFVESFQRLRDVGLRLILEEAFVALLSETCRSIDDEFGVGAVRNTAVGCQIVCMKRLPTRGRVIRFDLEKYQVLLPVEVPGHFRERFPIKSLVVDAHSAPPRFVLKNLVKQRRDAGASLTRSGVTQLSHRLAPATPHPWPPERVIGKLINLFVRPFQFGPAIDVRQVVGIALAFQEKCHHVLRAHGLPGSAR